MKLRLLALSALTLSCSCSMLNQRWRSEVEPLRSTVPSAYRISGIEPLEQQDKQCGPAALSSVLGWSGLSVSPERLRETVFTPGLNGTLQSDIIGGARRYGRIAYPIEPRLGALLIELAHGHPVIVLENRGLSFYPLWHYALAVGYDLDEGEIELFSGEQTPERLPLRVFKHLWDRSENWALLVLRPQELPATAEKHRYLEAASALERAGHVPEALVSYQTAQSHWPEDSEIVTAVGNAYYLLRNLRSAEGSYRKAIDLEQGNEVALNNLAQLMLEQKRFGEALIWARRAVARGGQFESEAKSTLQEALKAGTSSRPKLSASEPFPESVAK